MLSPFRRISVLRGYDEINSSLLRPACLARAPDMIGRLSRSGGLAAAPRQPRPPSRTQSFPTRLLRQPADLLFDVISPLAHLVLPCQLHSYDLRDQVHRRYRFSTPAKAHVSCLQAGGTEAMLDDEKDISDDKAKSSPSRAKEEYVAKDTLEDCPLFMTNPPKGPNTALSAIAAIIDEDDGKKNPLRFSGRKRRVASLGETQVHMVLSSLETEPAAKRRSQL
eukprot:6208588-Pleurochrysis_carterae.AAC.1